MPQNISSGNVNMPLGNFVPDTCCRMTSMGHNELISMNGLVNNIIMLYKIQKLWRDYMNMYMHAVLLCFALFCCGYITGLLIRVVTIQIPVD